MGNILPTAARLQALAAIKQVTDEFMVTPVAYELWQDVPSLWGDNRSEDPGRFAPYALNALNEYPDNTDSEAIYTENGNMHRADVKLTFNMEDLIAQNLMDPVTKRVPFTVSDRFTVRGDRYYTKKVVYDGPLSAQSVLLIVYGSKDDKRA